MLYRIEGGRRNDPSRSGRYRTTIAALLGPQNGEIENGRRGPGVVQRAPVLNSERFISSSAARRRRRCDVPHLALTSRWHGLEETAMRHVLRVGMIILSGLCGHAASVMAAERGTPAEAKSMLGKALAHYQSVGREQALKDFNGRKAPFGERDLYVFCLSAAHVIVANGGFPSLIGSKGDVLKDVEGKPVASAMWDQVNAGGQGAVQYRWFNPMTRKQEPKISFVASAGTDLCGVGAYDPGAGD
jgi:hypothetical protein